LWNKHSILFIPQKFVPVQTNAMAEIQFHHNMMVRLKFNTKFSSISAISWCIEPKLCINHWKVLYKLCVFYVDRNSKMTTTAGHSFYIGSCVNTMTCGGSHLGFTIGIKNRGPSNDHSWAVWFSEKKRFETFFPWGPMLNKSCRRIVIPRWLPLQDIVFT
jgi:hypothetical protein